MQRYKQQNMYYNGKNLKSYNTDIIKNGELLVDPYSFSPKTTKHFHEWIDINYNNFNINMSGFVKNKLKRIINKVKKYPVNISSIIVEYNETMTKNELHKPNDHLSGVPVYFNYNTGIYECTYKKSDCNCGRKYKSENGFKRAHYIEY